MPARADVAAVAWRPLLALAGGVAVVLVALSGRYGYSRDELYFLAAGQHLEWGYPDQPPLTPLLARAASAVAGDSLVALRLPSALAAAGVVVLTGLLARELGGSRVPQLLAAACMAASALLLAVGHLFGTSVLDLLVWTALTLVTVRALRTGNERLWLLAGLVAGVGLLNKSLVLFLLAALAAGLLVAGPREVFRSPWLWSGAALAALLWASNLWWQAQNGWPQLELSRAIAAGGSGTSESRLAFVPFQLVLIGPFLVPVWAAGLVRLLRDPRVRFARCLAVAYLLLVVVFVVTGGKPYYLGGLYPALLAAGSAPVVAWASDRTDRRRIVMAALAVSAAVSAVLMLPLVPASSLHRTPIVDINYDAGETVGWPAFVETVATGYRAIPDAERQRAVILTGNYGEAGAIDRFGPARGLPPVYSGHNAYWQWGPPPEGSGAVLAVGMDEQRLQQLFASVQAVATVDNGVDLDNEEQGQTVYLCRGLRSSWAAVWPQLRHLG